MTNQKSDKSSKFYDEPYLSKKETIFWSLFCIIISWIPEFTVITLISLVLGYLAGIGF